MRTSNLTDGGGGQTLGSTPSTSLNNNQFGNVVKGAAMATPVGAGLAAGAAAAKAAPKVAKAAAGAAGNVAKGAAGVAGKVAGAQMAVAKGAAGVAGKVVGAQVNAAKAVGNAAVKAAPIAARAAGGAALASPLAAGGAAAYGASQTPGGKSIIKGAIQGAKGPNGGFGVLGAPAAAVKGAVTSQGAKNVASGMGKGALIGAIGGPIGSALGAGIGAIGGLFSNRGMGPKKAPTAPGSPVPNRATPYTVQKGDTLTSIAKAKGTTVDALRQANPKFTEKGSKYNNGNMIWSGTKVNMPGANNQKMKDAGKGLKVNKNMAGK